MTHTVQLQLSIPESQRGQRLDRALAALVQDYSRSRLQQWIRAGQVTLDGRVPQVRERVQGGESVRIDAELVEQTTSQPEAIPLDIVYEDADLLGRTIEEWEAIVLQSRPSTTKSPVKKSWETATKLLSRSHRTVRSPPSRAATQSPASNSRLSNCSSCSRRLSEFVSLFTLILRMIAM